jgi:glycosyltransferase involved in cell wall biosynthesis
MSPSGPDIGSSREGVDLSIILPTRDRAKDVRRLYDSLLDTAADPDRIQIVLYLDDDDPTGPLLEEPRLAILQAKGPRTTMGRMLRRAIKIASGEYIMLTNDDAAFRTPEWDSKILSASRQFADGVSLVWCNDLFRRDAIPNFPIFSRRVYDMIPTLIPARYVRDYVDTHLLDIFTKLEALGWPRKVYLEDVVLEHLHVEAGKAEPDSVSQKSRHFADELTYFSGEQQRALTAKRLAAHIQAEETG